MISSDSTSLFYVKLLYIIIIILAQIIFVYLPFAFSYDPTGFSSIGCKIFYYLNNALDALSPWYLVYISAEKLITIACPHKRFILKRKKNQIIYLISLYFFNIFYYINIPFSVDIFSYGESSFCQNYKNEEIIYNMDVINCIIVPFLLITLISITIIGSIFMAKKRVKFNNSAREINRLNKDIKFAKSLISINFLFILLNLTVEILNFFPSFNNYDLNAILSYVFFLSSALNFYLLLVTNSLFRKQFFLLFQKINTLKNKKDQVELIAETAF